MDNLGDFDASDPFDAMAESIRRQVCDVVLEMQRVAVYRDLDPHRQIECLMAGLVTGTIGVLFSHVRPEGWDVIIEEIVRYLPHARLNVEEIIAGQPHYARAREASHG